MTRAPLTEAIQTEVRYVAPTRGTALMNRSVRRLVRMGISVWGARDLRLRGRKSGEVRSTVVNVLDLDGERFLVAPRGTTEWVKNLRAAGEGELRVGRRVEPFVAHELTDAEELPVLRAYLTRWKWEVGQFFQGVGPDAPDADLIAIAPGYPIFRLTDRSAAAAA
jgi:deazaflavin-dependent oxidoreductase (nitroreductase family)